MTFTGNWLLIPASIAILLIAKYVAAFLKRRRIINTYPVPGPLPCTWNIFWPFGVETYMIVGKLIKNINPGRALFELTDSFTCEYRSAGLYRTWVLFRPVVSLIRAETAEVILKSTIETHKSKEVALIETWLGQGLLTGNGPKWHRKRKMLTPVFHFNILEEFVPAMNEQAALLADILLEQKGKDIDIFNYLGKCTLNIICETAMGISINAQCSESEYLQCVHLVTKGFINRAVSPWLWSDFIYRISPSGREYYRHLKVVHEFTRKVILARMKEMQEQPSLIREAADENGLKRRQPFLDTLLIKHLENNELTLEEIREEVDTFMFAGHDTTAIALMWLLYLLGLYPEVQAKVHDELDRVFGDDRKRPVTMEDLNELKYLECVIKESLRLYPSVPAIARRLLNDCVIGKYRLPAGGTVVIDVFRIHRDPEAFENPENFDPDRFLPENMAKLNPYTFIPFSGGPRNCIGQKFAIREEKVILATILRRLQVKSLLPRERLTVVNEVVVRPIEPVMVKIRERPKNNNDYFK